MNHLQTPQGMGWKTAPNPGWLCRLELLWKKFLAIAPNGVIPSKKNRVALEKLQERRTGVKTKDKQSPEDHAEACDELIRIGLSHLRFLAQKEVNRIRCFRKCDPTEIGILENILGMITEVETEQTDDSQTTDAGPSTRTPEETEEPPSALVPVTSRPSTSGSSEDALAIFKAVNSRPDLEQIA